MEKVTGLQMYDELKRSTKHLPMGSSFSLNAIEVKDLSKLTISDLEDRGFDHKMAKAVSGAF